MSIASRFFGKEEKVVVKDKDGKDFELVVRPLKGKDMDLFLGLQNPHDKVAQAKAMRTIFKKVMEDNIPDITEEEIDNISMDVFLDVIEVAGRVNGLTDDKRRVLLTKQNA